MVAFKKGRSGSEKQFPGKLHDMMSFVEANGLESIISWALNGYGIQINNPERLVEILPLFFGQTKYRSFRRQLNMWHFNRILEGPNKGIFVHPFFVKHNRDMCAQMSRQISFKSALQMDQGNMNSKPCIEPSPLADPASASEKDTFKIKSSHMSVADFFPVSALDLPSASGKPLPPLPPLKGETTSSFGAACKVIENVMGKNHRSNDIPFWQCGLNDGDLVSFEGKNFFFVDGDFA